MSRDLVIPITPATTLIAFQHRAVQIDGTLATHSLDAVGLVTTKVDSGEEGSVNMFGRNKFVAGAAVARGARLKVTSGGFMTTAGSGDYSVGKCEIGVASGSVGRGVFDFMHAGYQATSYGI